MSKKVEDIKKVAVVGAGTMGSGIAQVVASNDREVLLIDVSDAALDRGMKIVEKSLGRLLKKEAISQEENDLVLNRITTTTKFEDLREKRNTKCQKSHKLRRAKLSIPAEIRRLKST